MIIAHTLSSSGVVTNTIVLADGANPADFGATIAPDGVGIGWSLNGSDWSPPSEPTPAPQTLSEAFETARQLVSNHVNLAAQTRNYDDAVSCASYIGSTNKTWAAEATAFVAWRDAVWAHVFALRDQAIAGSLASLPSADDLIAGLPAMDWPLTI